MREYKIAIENIEVDEEYYSFSYKVFVDGELSEEDYYEDSYENGNTPEEWRKKLEEYAYTIALRQYIDDKL